jgi:hypothetical protein
VKNDSVIQHQIEKRMMLENTHIYSDKGKHKRNKNRTSFLKRLFLIYNTCRNNNFETFYTFATNEGTGAVVEPIGNCSNLKEISFNSSIGIPNSFNLETNASKESLYPFCNFTT